MSSFWRRQWHPTPVLLLAKSHGRRRSLMGYSPWGHEESDTTEQIHFHFSLSCIGKGNGNPLQYSCLENPRDRQACWAAVYGVAQNRTRPTWLSSSSCRMSISTARKNPLSTIYSSLPLFPHSSWKPLIFFFFFGCLYSFVFSRML